MLKDDNRSELLLGLLKLCIHIRHFLVSEFYSFTRVVVLNLGLRSSVMSTLLGNLFKMEFFIVPS